MALKSGLAGQIGFVTETTSGVAKAPTLFLPIVDESIGLAKERLESQAIIAGRRVLDSNQWAGGPSTAAGDVGLELTNRGLGTLFRHMFGGKATTGTNPYTHTFTPGDLSGLSMTAQVGVPGVGGTVHPKTASGCKVTSWELACSAGEIATLGLSVVGTGLQFGSRTVTDGATGSGDATVTSSTGAFTQADVGKSVTGTGIPTGAYIASVTNSTTIELSANATATATNVSLTFGLALASATLPSGIKPFTFVQGSLLIGGSSVNVKAATVTGDNGLATDRRFLGTEWIAEPLEADHRMFGGTYDLEFTDLTQFERFKRGDEFASVLAFSDGTNSVTITTNSRFDDAKADLSGKGIVEHSLPVKHIGTTDAAAITAVLVNADSSAD